jgi:hypothetical protein
MFVRRRKAKEMLVEVRMKKARRDETLREGGEKAIDRLTSATITCPQGKNRTDTRIFTQNTPMVLINESRVLLTVIQ